MPLNTDAGLANQPLTHAPATIYLVSRSADRLSEGRRIAASVVSKTETDTSKALRGIHPDIIELAPPDGKERIGIGQVRDVIRSAQFAPTQSDCKVCLIANAESLTLEASNALLKILEEPPRGLRFILLAEHPSDLLPTIVSRSRLIRIPIAAETQISARLAEIGYANEAAAWVSRLALRDGELDRFSAAPIDIPQLLMQTNARLSATDMPGMLAACLGNDPVTRRQSLMFLLLRIADCDPELLTLGVGFLAAQTRESLARLFHELLSTAFDLIRTAQRPTFVPDALADQVRDRLGVHQLHEFCFALDDAHRALAVYGPVEGILLSLFLTSEGGDHDS
jgi:hypothetical protein